jgi:hypothetical protein
MRRRLFDPLRWLAANRSTLPVSVRATALVSHGRIALYRSPPGLPSGRRRSPPARLRHISLGARLCQ